MPLLFTVCIATWWHRRCNRAHSTVRMVIFPYVNKHVADRSTVSRIAWLQQWMVLGAQVMHSVCVEVWSTTAASPCLNLRTALLPRLCITLNIAAGSQGRQVLRCCRGPGQGGAELPRPALRQIPGGQQLPDLPTSSFFNRAVYQVTLRSGHPRCIQEAGQLLRHVCCRAALGLEHTRVGALKCRLGIHLTDGVAAKVLPSNDRKVLQPRASLPLTPEVSLEPPAAPAAQNPSPCCSGVQQIVMLLPRSAGMTSECR